MLLYFKQYFAFYNILHHKFFIKYYTFPTDENFLLLFAAQPLFTFKKRTIC